LIEQVSACITLSWAVEFLGTLLVCAAVVVASWEVVINGCEQRFHTQTR